MPKFLFLDRDGVINERLPNAYVQKTEEFKFAKGCLDIFFKLNEIFDRVFIVTNQQGIGKEFMTEEDLSRIHLHMKTELEKAGGHLDGIYHCPDLVTAIPNGRKPNPSMAFQAKKDFPEVDFSKSIMVGDSISDMYFGKRLGMETILIKSNPDQVEKSSMLIVDQEFDSLFEYANSLV